MSIYTRLAKASIYNTAPDPKKKRRKRSKRKRDKKLAATNPTQLTNLQKFANKLNQNLPKSEVWFQHLYEHFKAKEDLYNTPLAPYIPDVHNPNYKYIIEIDGAIHDLPEIKAKDAKKTKYYVGLGYRVFRIKAYNEPSFKQVIDEITRLRKEKDSGKLPKVILRKNSVR